MDIADTWPDHEVDVDAVARNLVSYYVEINRLLGAFAQHRNLYSSSLGPLQKLRYIAGAHVVRGFSVDGDNHVARPDACAIGRSARKWCNYNDFVVARSDLHAHAVILAALLLAQRRIRLRIEEVGVRI